MTDETKYKILILFAHPALQRSNVNLRLIEGLDTMTGVTFHDLYEEYPDFYIDVEREQQLLIEHDIIVMHYPFYWYSTPAILKEWQDMVLLHGWAYGHEGDALAGKIIFNTITTGGPEEAYSAGGYNHFSLCQLLAPLEQTANLCRMTWLPPFAVHGTHLMTPEIIEDHARDYHHLLRALVAGTVDLDLAADQDRLNSDLDRIIREAAD
ncbi:NAD(P)H-dependent oxidoreductase, partial [Candidatus Zixiibacteriota bacterium]